MRRTRVLGGISLALVLAIGALTFAISRPRGPQALIGPHKTPMRWVSYADASRKPIIDIAPFGLGPFKWPRSPLEGCELGDPRLVSGFLIIQTELGMEAEVESANFIPQFRGPASPLSYIAQVPFPKSEGAARFKVRIGTETVDVSIPFDPLAMPARYEPSEMHFGPHRVRVSYFGLDGDVVLVRMRILDPEAPRRMYRVRTETAAGMSDSSSYGTEPFDLWGEILPSGEIEVNGTLGLEVGKHSTMHKMDFRLKPRPVP